MYVIIRFETEHNTNTEFRYKIGFKTQQVVELFAVLDGQEIPEIFTTPEAQALRVVTVFYKELKNNWLKVG